MALIVTVAANIESGRAAKGKNNLLDIGWGSSPIDAGLR
jgi:hypothetical protein